MPAPTKTTSASTLGSGHQLELRAGVDRVLDDGGDALALITFECETRSTDPLAALAGHLVGELDVLDELGRDIEVQQRHEPTIEIERLGDLACLRQLDELHDLA